MKLENNVFSLANAEAIAEGHFGLHWLQLDEARAAVEAALRKFGVGLAAEDEEARAIALRVTVGVGKSAAVRSLLAETAHWILPRGHILVYVPTHVLAEEAEAAFRALNTGFPSMVLRGRHATDPDTGGPMCQKSDLAQVAAKVSPWGVTGLLCQAQDPPDIWPMRRGSCREGCAWFEQLPGEEKRIIFLPHAYLSSAVPGGIAQDVALRIIDEKFLSSILHTQTLYVDEWLQRCSCASVVQAGTQVCRHEARRLVHQALLHGKPIIRALADAGLGSTALKAFEGMEKAEMPQLEVTPWMMPVVQRRLIQDFDIQAFFRARARARLWSMLQEDWATGISERISLDEEPCMGGPPRSVIRMHSCGTIPWDAPLILLDADADPTLVETLVPGSEFVSINVSANADVIQIEDQTFSNAALLSRPNSAERRREILDLVVREVAAAKQGVLLVATKEVLRQLHLDEDPDGEMKGDNDLLRPLYGAHARWFGPGMQGVNRYEAFDTAIVLGRLQPPIEAIEGQMRAVFGNCAEQLALIPADDRTRGWYREVDASYLMSDGTTRPAKVRTHPDPRGAALLAQSREAYTIQAIGRIRAVNALVPKRILILCNMPLPGFLIDSLVLWQELVTGLSRLELGTKARNLESALYPYGRSMPVSGLRLSGEGIRADAPEVFKNASSGAEWRRDLPIATIFDLIRTIARRRGGRPLFITLKRPGGGKRTPAVLFDPPADLAAAATRLWPGLELDFIVRA
jgi:hypothetical protein